MNFGFGWLFFEFEWQSFRNNADLIAPDTDNLVGIAQFDNIVAELLHFGGFFAQDVFEQGSFGVDLNIGEFADIQ